MVYSPARRYQWPLIFSGVVLFIAVLVAQNWLPQFKNQLMLLTLVSIVMLVAGLATRLEPEVSLSLAANKLRYFHRYGQWSVRWHNIERVFQPSFSYALERKDIPYIAIKLNDFEVMAEHVSPRLASRLIHEQRGIMVLACQQGDISHEQLQVDFSAFKMQSGYEFTGPIAGWLHQMKVLNQAYGAHLFIPQSCYSQSNDQLIALLKEHRRRHFLQEESARGE